MRGGLEPGEVGEGGVEIDQFDHGLGSGSAPRDSRSTHDKWDLGSNIEKGHLPPEEVIAEVIAMIGGEHNDSVLPVAILYQRIKDQFQLGVDKGDTGMVGLHVFPAQGVIFPAEFKAEGVVSF